MRDAAQPAAVGLCLLQLERHLHHSRLSPGGCRWQRAAGAHDYEAVVEAAVVEVEELRAVEGATAVDARAGLTRHPALRVCGVGVRERSGS